MNRENRLHDLSGIGKHVSPMSCALLTLLAWTHPLVIRRIGPLSISNKEFTRRCDIDHAALRARFEYAPISRASDRFCCTYSKTVGAERKDRKMGSMILVVDDERSIAKAAMMVLESQGYCALALYNAADAIAMLRTIDVALIVSDMNMPEIDGIDLALKVRELCPRTGILLMSGGETAETVRTRLGCEGCPFEIMAKPFGAQQLMDRIKRMVH
jgi:CheY-like chemotaxis protein